MTERHEAGGSPGGTLSQRILRVVTSPASRGGQRALLMNVVLYALALAFALGLGALLVVVATDASPWSVYEAMYEGSLSDGAALGQTLDEAVPILIVALGAVIATRAGIINIGNEGQVVFGAMVGTFVALGYPGGGPIPIVLTLIAATAGGALWAGIAALLRFTRGVDVVISTLLLNFVAFEAVSFAVNRDWLLRETAINVAAPQSDRVPPDTHLPRLGQFPDFNVSTGIIIAAVSVVAVAVVLRRSRWGFRLRILGLNPTAAARSGVSVAAFGTAALLLSGGFAGLAGGVMLTGSVFRLQPAFANNVGFDGLLVALIARRRAGWTVPVAFFFGALRAGGGFLAATGVPRFLVNVVQALLVLAALFPPVFLDLRRRRIELARARAAAQAPTGPTVAAGVPA